MHLQSQNYVEAALTLKLHSDLYEWDLASFVDLMDDLGLPRQSHFHRKETLCLLILDYLGLSKKSKSFYNQLMIDQVKGRLGKALWQYVMNSRSNIPPSPSTSTFFDQLVYPTAYPAISARLSEILRHKAALLEHIVTDQRYYPDYFRVAFYGSSFPVAIRNKQFVVSALQSLCASCS